MLVFTFPAIQTLNGESSRTFTGIPSGVNIVKFGVWRSKRCTGTGAPKIQIGDSGGIETTGYVGIDVFAGTGALAYGGTGQTDGWGPSSWTSNR